MRPKQKKEHFPNAFLIYRALTWKLYKKNSPNVKQQNYSVATGGRWKDVPNEIRNVYTQLSIKLSEDNHVPDGFLIFRAISWETLKERYPNATIASEEWDRLPSEDKTFYIKLYEELSEATKKKKILKSKLKKQKSKRVQKPQINSQNLTDQSPHFPYNGFFYNHYHYHDYHDYFSEYYDYYYNYYNNNIFFYIDNNI